MGFTIRPYKRGGWEYDLRLKLPDGTPYQERRRAPGTTKADAKEYARQREAHLIRNGLAEMAEASAPKIPLLRDYAPRWLEKYSGERKLKPASLQRYASILDRHILPRLGHLPLDAINSLSASELAASMRDYSLAHQRGAQVVLSRLLHVAVRWEILGEFPIKHPPEIPRPQPSERWYSPRDCARLVEAARKRDAATYLMVLLGVDAGLRAGEIRALAWSDLDLEEGRMVVRQSDWHGHTGTTKSGKERAVALTPRLLAGLKEYRHLRGPRVLLSSDGTSPGYSTLRAWLQAAQRLAGLPEAGQLHVLRHTFCSRLARAGAPARSIQALAGHASLTTTQGYMHLSPLEVERSIDLLGDGDRKETETGAVEKSRK